TVQAVASDGAGGWFIGGIFTQVGGAPRSGMAHILANHTLSPWNPSFNNVAAMVVNGSTVYAAGGGGIAAIDATTGGQSSWDPDANGPVNTLALSGGLLYAGGQFNQIGGALRDHIAAVSLTTGEATPWNPSANNAVRSIVISGGTLYVGGSFTRIGGQV